jgi:hypothetical protein
MPTANEKSEADLVRQTASDQVDWKIRELTANLLRITRGAGKPEEIMRQMNDLAAAIRGYWDAFGLSPYGDEFARALDVSHDLETTRNWSSENRDRDFAEHRIIRGALQVVASRLAHQTPHETLGRGEMYGGIKALEDIRAKGWETWTKITRDDPPTRRGVNVTTSPKLKAKRARPRKPV